MYFTLNMLLNQCHSLRSFLSLISFASIEAFDLIELQLQKKLDYLPVHFLLTIQNDRV